MSSTHEPVLDKLLDRLVLPGYSSLGYTVRSRGWRAGDPAPDALVGRRFLVTGAAGGLGEAAALGLARLGAHVHLVVRSERKAHPARDRITTALAHDVGPGARSARVSIGVCDVSDLNSVRSFAAGLSADLGDDALDGIIHNAGVMPPHRTTSAQGHELSVATHLLGPVLMTDLLLPALARSNGGARVEFVASGGMYTQALPMEDPEYTHGSYRGAVAYARSKRMQVELLPVLAARWGQAGVHVYGMHPGWVDTPGVETSMPLFRSVTRRILRTPQQGADTMVWLAATSPAPTTGTWWHDRAERPTSYLPSTRPDPGEVEALWAWTADAAGLD